jgi:hypothetical protein
MQRNRVHQPDLVATIGEPGRVDAERATDVEHGGRRCGQQPFEQHLGAHQFQRPVEAGRLATLLVVGEYFFVKHGPKLVLGAWSRIRLWSCA